MFGYGKQINKTVKPEAAKVEPTQINRSSMEEIVRKYQIIEKHKIDMENEDEYFSINSSLLEQ